ncbi:MAG: hypothetical protein ACRD5H_14665, partial [Nitrososphaerales archaeon]
VWDEHYAQIFSGHVVEPHIVSVLINLHAADWVRGTGLTSSSDDVIRTLAKKGTLHIARMEAYYWRGSDGWSDGPSLKAHLQSLQADNSILDPCLDKGFKELDRIIRLEAHYLADIDSALKSYTLDERIDKVLHPSVTPIL